MACITTYTIRWAFLTLYKLVKTVVSFFRLYGDVLQLYGVSLHNAAEARRKRLNLSRPARLYKTFAEA